MSMIRRFGALPVTAVALLSPAAAWAQPMFMTDVTEIPRPAGLPAGAQLGSAGQIEGDTLIIGTRCGASGEPCGTTHGDVGSIEVYDLSPSGVHIAQHLAGPTDGSADALGTALALTGNSIVAGASYAGTGDTGAVLFFSRATSTDTFVAGTPELPVPGGAFFGSTVAASGDLVVVGGPYWGRFDSDPGLGAVWTYTRTSGTESWTFHSTPVLEAPAGRFGNGIAVDGTTVAVRCNSTSTQGPCGSLDASGVGEAAIIYIYEADDAGGLTLQTAIHPRPEHLNNVCPFGDGLSIDHDRIVIGCSRETYEPITGPGRVDVYVRSGTTWTREISTIVPAAADAMGFGVDAVVVGDVVWVTDPMTDGRGRVWAFDDGVEVLRYTLPAAVADDGLAILDVQGNVAVIGAPGLDDGSDDSAGGAWLLRAGYADGDACDSDSECFNGSCNAAGLCGPDSSGDAGAPVADGGVDGGGVADGGTSSEMDAGSSLDAGMHVVVDGGELSDAGSHVAMDGGARADGGPYVEADGGQLADSGVQPRPDLSCTCRTVGRRSRAPGWLVALGAVALGIGRRLRRRSRR